MKSYICDFEDSFTYNIYSEMTKLDFVNEVSVIDKTSISSFLIQKINHCGPEKILIVLGPGPGHPDNYNNLIGLIESLLSNSNVFLLGICLGHQLICKSLGFETGQAKMPLHAKAVSYSLDSKLASTLNLPQKILVQRYNSLTPKFNNDFSVELQDYLVVDDEVVICSGKSFVSYQFHPESVGTTCPNVFFETLERFLL